MATIDQKSIEKVRRLYYDNQLSIQDVADKLDVSIDAVSYCMRKNGLKRRKINESNSIRYERLAASFKLRKLSTEKLKILKVIGIMLYWGEGSKWDGEKIVDFANSDKDMIVLFLRFLRRVCGINEKKLRVFPYFYSNQDIKENLKYWHKITGIRKDQFTKPYIRKNFRIEKRNKMPHGLVHIRYADKKLLRLIKTWIDEYKSF